MSVADTEKELSIYESMAARFDVAARKLNLDEGLYRYLRTPNREIIVHIPVALDNGRLEVFDGFRVQHSIARGPCKGGLRYGPYVTLDEIRGIAALVATGRGFMIVCDQALKRFGVDRQSTRVIVQGCGNVGSQAARLMHEAGYKIVGVAAIHGGVLNTHGLGIPALLEYVKENKTVKGFPEGEPTNAQEILEQDCEILLPAAIESVIN